MKRDIVKKGLKLNSSINIDAQFLYGDVNNFFQNISSENLIDDAKLLENKIGEAITELSILRHIFSGYLKNENE